MSAPQKIIDLVEDFKENKQEYLNPDVFDEENTKIKFLNPFFEELGWNVRNEGLSARFREVVFEDSIKVGSKTKAPDYSFRLGGQRIFFVEAKKPSRDIKKDKDHAFQVRRYGWSAGLPLCILTDFEELAVYDTTIKPSKNQSASIGRIKYYKYTEYINKWDEIYNIFSKEAVLSGKFDNYANNVKQDKKGTSEVDDEFLKEIENWRLLLARNIALRNTQLNIDELNYAVQLIIDRIIFLRIAEDRKIERYGRLRKLLEKPDIYKNFTKICKEADAKYNSGLFHFDPYDKEDFTTDTYTLNLTIDDKIFKEIFKNLYYPDSPYEFSVISTEILGKVYEQFLGRVIRLTESHQAKVEEKPEVKKAGGVYYTPQYIVDYIVENTVGQKIEGLTPNQISKIKIIDPACGSGSFLIRAYQYLLDYHLDYYTKLEKRPKNVIYTAKDGIERLTINEKKRILKNNIYGVDIDTLAVEVTKLSLLLKVLEDQNKEVVEQQQKLFHERALPNLSSNIKNGNSLIANDILEEQELTEEEISKINPFDWEDEFPEIFPEANEKKHSKETSHDDGFDVIIGNPPYVRQESIKEQKPYYKEHYETYVGTADLYVYFFEKGLNVLKQKGYFGFICSNKWVKAKYGKTLRETLLNYKITEYIDYSNEKIFDNATVDVSTILINKDNPKNNEIKISNSYTMKQEYLEIDGYNFMKNNLFQLKNKLLKYPPIKNIEGIFINRGVTTGFNKAFVIDEDVKNQLQEGDMSIIKPVLRGKDINKFQINYQNLYLIFSRRGIDINEYVTVKEYLTNFKKELTPRKKGNNSDIGRKPGDYKWYEIQDTTKYYSEFEKDKIIWKEISTEPSFTLDKNKYYLLNNAYFLTSTINLNYLLSIFNSNVAKWFFDINSINLGSRGRRFTRQYVEKLPIKLPKSYEEESIFDEDITKLLSFKKELQNVKTPKERKLLQKQIESTDKKINQMIYELYDLTEEEIKIIEENI